MNTNASIDFRYACRKTGNVARRKLTRFMKENQMFRKQIIVALTLIVITASTYNTFADLDDDKSKCVELFSHPDGVPPTDGGDDNNKGLPIQAVPVAAIELTTAALANKGDVETANPILQRSTSIVPPGIPPETMQYQGNRYFLVIALVLILGITAYFMRQSFRKQ